MSFSAPKDSRATGCLRQPVLLQNSTPEKMLNRYPKDMYFFPEHGPEDPELSLESISPLKKRSNATDALGLGYTDSSFGGRSVLSERGLQNDYYTSDESSFNVEDHVEAVKEHLCNDKEHFKPCTKQIKSRRESCQQSSEHSRSIGSSDTQNLEKELQSLSWRLKQLECSSNNTNKTVDDLRQVLRHKDVVHREQMEDLRNEIFEDMSDMRSNVHKLSNAQSRLEDSLLQVSSTRINNEAFTGYGQSYLPETRDLQNCSCQVADQNRSVPLITCGISDEAQIENIDGQQRGNENIGDCGNLITDENAERLLSVDMFAGWESERSAHNSFHTEKASLRSPERAYAPSFSTHSGSYVENSTTQTSLLSSPISDDKIQTKLVTALNSGSLVSMSNQLLYANKGLQSVTKNPFASMFGKKKRSKSHKK